MPTFQDVSQSETERPTERLPLPDLLRYRVAALRIRLRPLWPQAQRLGHWVESQAAPLVRRAGRDVARLAVEDNGRVELLGVNVGASERTLEGLSRLCGFLRQIGVRRLELDVRMKHNQLTDTLALLLSCRRALTDGESRRSSGGLAGRLLSADGVSFASVNVRLDGQTLTVGYIYCLTRFSRIVRRFERRHPHFSDHRALFHAAPRYAAAPVAIMAAILVLYFLHESPWLLVAAAAVGTAALSATAYLFFMIVGSVEYDNEEKAYRLERAYGDLRRYADRIQDDLGRARNVQENLLPDLSAMPLADRIDWAGYFLPETEVGGDYFDAAEMSSGRVAILFADVSGHGMAAAFMTAILKCSFQDWTDHAGPLEGFVRQANQNLCRLIPAGSFAVVFVAVYDGEARQLTYCNCGHDPEPWLIPADRGEPIVRLSEARSMLLGVDGDIQVRTAERALRPGDKVFLATDGMTEARSVEGELYGQERMQRLLRARRELPVGRLVASAVEDVGNYARGAEQTDDRTVLAFQVR